MTKLNKLMEAFLSDTKYYKTKEGKVSRWDTLKPGKYAATNAVGSGAGMVIGNALGAHLTGAAKFTKELKSPTSAIIGAAGVVGGGLGALWGAKSSNKKMAQRALPNLKKLGAKEITKDEYKTSKKTSGKMGFMQRMRVFNKKPENFTESAVSKVAKKVAEVKPFKLKSGMFEGKNATTLKTAIQKAKQAAQEKSFKRTGRGL